MSETKELWHLMSDDLPLALAHEARDGWTPLGKPVVRWVDGSAYSVYRMGRESLEVHYRPVRPPST